MDELGVAPELPLGAAGRIDESLFATLEIELNRRSFKTRDNARLAILVDLPRCRQSPTRGRRGSPRARSATEIPGDPEVFAPVDR